MFTSSQRHILNLVTASINPYFMAVCSLDSVRIYFRSLNKDLPKAQIHDNYKTCELLTYLSYCAQFLSCRRSS